MSGQENICFNRGQVENLGSWNTGIVLYNFFGKLEAMTGRDGAKLLLGHGGCFNGFGGTS